MNFDEDHHYDGFIEDLAMEITELEVLTFAASPKIFANLSYYYNPFPAIGCDNYKKNPDLERLVAFISTT